MWGIWGNKNHQVFPGLTRAKLNEHYVWPPRCIYALSVHDHLFGVFGNVSKIRPQKVCFGMLGYIYFLRSSTSKNIVLGSRPSHVSCTSIKVIVSNREQSSAWTLKRNLGDLKKHRQLANLKNREETVSNCARHILIYFAYTIPTIPRISWHEKPRRFYGSSADFPFEVPPATTLLNGVFGCLWTFRDVQIYTRFLGWQH